MRDNDDFDDFDEIEEIDDYEELEELSDEIDDIYEDLYGYQDIDCHGCIGCTHHGRLGYEHYCDCKQDIIYDTADGCDCWSPDY